VSSVIPSIEYPSGYKEWWVKERKHRFDGPAVEELVKPMKSGYIIVILMVMAK
jgi:hypothetical protein